MHAGRPNMASENNNARTHDDSIDDFIVKKGRSRSHGHGPSR